MDYKDYYQILGISRDAKQDEIKKAYRKLARKYHPDVNQGDTSAEARFKDINEAYEVLGDPDKRTKYDQFGSQWEQYSRMGGRPEDFNWSQWASPGGRTYTQNISQEDLARMFGGSGGMGGFSDFFETLFGGMGGRSGFGGPTGFQQNVQARSRDMEHTVEITLEEAFHGTTRRLQYEDGRSIEAKIPRGVKTGSKIRLSGQGGSGGDLYLKVKVLTDNRFERDGDDLKTAVPVDLYTLLLGGTAEVPSIDKTVKLTIPAGTANGKQFRLRGLGMPKLRHADKRGDLYATVEVLLPQNLTEREQELFSDLRDLRS